LNGVAVLDTAGEASGHLVPLLYEVADDWDLPEVARGEDGRMGWRMQARHRLHEPERPVDRAGDGDIVAVLRACRSARDRLIDLSAVAEGVGDDEVGSFADLSCRFPTGHAVPPHGPGGDVLADVCGTAALPAAPVEAPWAAPPTS
jgi:hypothetical protein